MESQKQKRLSGIGHLSIWADLNKTNIWASGVGGLHPGAEQERWLEEIIHESKEWEGGKVRKALTQAVWEAGDGTSTHWKEG